MTTGRRDDAKRPSGSERLIDMRTLRAFVSSVALTVICEIAGAGIIIDDFDGPSLDPGWTVVGQAGSFSTNPGSYTVTTEYPNYSGLSRTVGVGDFEVMIQYGRITGLAGANVRLDINDGTGFFVIMAEAPRYGGWGPNIVADWNNGTGGNQRLMSVQISNAPIDDLAFDILWSESTRTFVTKYKLNGAVWSSEYSAAYGVPSSPGRTATPWILAWDSGSGTTSAEMNGYMQINSVAVPEVDPDDAGSVLALVACALGLFERRGPRLVRHAT